ncbi:MAG: thioredoxin-like domain-containing protein [Mariniblastus sp.]|nr:thioredoxin-like domain-containing protein [Mariniblastus sp.]
MYPHERSLVKKLADQPFALIGVNSDKDREMISKVCKEKSITWRSFWNGPEGTGGPISSKWNVSGWPTIYILDEKGTIRFKNARGKKMDEAITELLAEMGHEVDLSNHLQESEKANEEAEKNDKKKDADPLP